MMPSPTSFVAADLRAMLSPSCPLPPSVSAPPCAPASQTFPTMSAVAPSRGCSSFPRFTPLSFVVVVVVVEAGARVLVGAEVSGASAAETPGSRSRVPVGIRPHRSRGCWARVLQRYDSLPFIQPFFLVRQAVRGRPVGGRGRARPGRRPRDRTPSMMAMLRGVVRRQSGHAYGRRAREGRASVP